MWPFKKKESETDAFQRELGLKGTNELGLENDIKPIEESYDKLGAGAPQFSPEPRRMEQPLQQQSQNAELQLISAKLDTIRAMLDVLNQRMSALEKHVEDKGKKLW